MVYHQLRQTQPHNSSQFLAADSISFDSIESDPRHYGTNALWSEPAPFNSLGFYTAIGLRKVEQFPSLYPS